MFEGSKGHTWIQIAGAGLMIPILAVCVILSFFSNYKSSQQEKQYTEAFVNYYVNNLDTVIANINRRLGMLLIEGSHIDTGIPSYLEAIQSTENEAYKNYYITKLQETFHFYSTEYGEEYNFFAFFPYEEVYVGTNDGNIGQREWEEYKKDILSKLDTEDIPVTGHPQWQSAKMEDKSYLIKCYKMEGIYLGCWVPMEKLIGGMKEITNDQKSAVYFYEEENEYLTAIGNEEGGTLLDKWKDSAPNAIFSNYYTLDKGFRSLPIHVRFFDIS